MSLPITLAALPSRLSRCQPLPRAARRANGSRTRCAGLPHPQRPPARAPSTPHNPGPRMQSAAAVRGQPLRVAQPRRAGAARRGAVQTQALFSFLAPPKAKAGPGKAQVRGRGAK